jgi:hypothetical protein
MTEEERKAKDAARKREAYARRKKAQATPNPLSKEQQEQAIKQILDANPELEEQFRKAEGNSEICPFPPGVLYQDSREKAEAILADSTARFEYVNHLFSKYEKNTNIPQLLQGIIREQIETRVVLIDLLAEILKGVSK